MVNRSMTQPLALVAYFLFFYRQHPTSEPAADVQIGCLSIFAHDSL
jgi:hypothetical protein